MQGSTVTPAVRFWTVAAGVCGAALWAPAAHAYLDPTTGSILLQGLLAGVAGTTVVLRLYWRRAKAFFRRVSGRA